MRRGLLVVLGLLLLVAGGAGYWAWRAGYIPFHKEDQIAVPPTPPPVEPPATLARTLFPSADQEARFSLDDGTKSTEWLMPDSDRVIQTYNGQVYITWFLTPEGVYRADPRGTGQPTLLRYLPAELKPGTAWKQPVSNGVVWFKLLKAEGECKPAGQTPAECWSLLVLNRGELTTFTFATGMGVVYARAENYATPRESFTKQMTAFGAPTGLDQKVRSQLIPKAVKLEQAARAPLEPATVDEFNKAVQDAAATKQGAAVSPVAPVDFAELKQHAWSKQAITVAGKEVVFYLYAPDAKYRTVTDSSCHGTPGEVDATAEHWAIYAGRDGGAPAQGFAVGAYELDHSRGLEVTPAPAAGMVFLGMSHTLSCNIHAETLLTAYDTVTGELFRPRLQRENHTVVDAMALNPSIDAAGQLTSAYYNNADGKNYTIIYTWDKASRMWRFASQSAKPLH